MQKIKEIIKEELNIDVDSNTRKREVIEARALYYHLIKITNPKMTLWDIAKSVNKTHASVMYGLKNYLIYEQFNDRLKGTKDIILDRLDSNYSIEYKNKKILELQNKLKEQSIHYKVISKLNNFLKEISNTDMHDDMIDRLEAVYEINRKVFDKKYLLQ